MSMCEAASSGAAKQRTCYTGADFQKLESISFKRKRGPLERSTQRKVKGTAKKSKRLCTGAPASTLTRDTR
jgi:hypothetical protein